MMLASVAGSKIALIFTELLLEKIQNTGCLKSLVTKRIKTYHYV